MRIRATLCLLLLVVLAVDCNKENPAKKAGPQRPLLVLLSTDVTSFDPQIPFDDSSVVLGNIFQHLVEFDANFQLIPGLATRWTNPDDRTWRFYLNPDAHFSDGSRLKASDVKFSLERLKGLTHSDLQGFTEHIAAVNVVDDFTLDLKTDTPFSILNNLVFIPILSEKQVTLAGDKIAETPMGTGPYRLEKWEKNKLIVLTQNPYSKLKPSIPKVEFVIEEVDKILDTLLKIKPDLSNALPFRMLEDFQKRKTADLRIVSSRGIAVFYVILSTKPKVTDYDGKNPLSDVRVRRAISFATNPAEFVSSITKGFGRIPTQLVAPEIFGYDVSIPPPEYNPEKARKLLADAGYSNLTVPIYTTTDGTHRFEKLTIEQWSKAGITGVLKLVSDDEYTRRQTAGDLPASVTGYSCSSGDASEILSFNLHTRNAAMTYGKGNFALYSNPEVDKIAEENLRTFNPKERLEMLQKAMRIVRDEVPYLPVLIFDDMYVVSNRIEWSPPASGEVRINEISFKQ